MQSSFSLCGDRFPPVILMHIAFALGRVEVDQGIRILRDEVIELAEGISLSRFASNPSSNLTVSLWPLLVLLACGLELQHGN